MKTKFLRLLTLFLVFFVFQTGCKKSENVGIDTSTVDYQINNFIWKGMNAYYLWTANIPALNVNNYSSQSDLDVFLSKYTDHNSLFQDLLYKPTDKWSWIVNDYVALENMFQGVTKTMGFEYGLVYIDNTNIFGVVFYVLKDSPAEINGLKRGDIFTKVDGVQLTNSNYTSLLNKDSYTLGFADIVNNTVVPNTRTVSLTATVLQENPIFLKNIFTIDNLKVGYLVYNGFVSNFDNQLNDAFKYFIDNGVQKLILDLRYNSGGAGISAVYLASMIHGRYKDKVLYVNYFNSLLQNYFIQKYGNEVIYTKLVENIEKSDVSSEQIINSLNLNEVFIITSKRTASASELLINGLTPHMNVVTIGTHTSGKYVGSITLKDIDQNGNVNPNHKWAMQPIIMKYANKEGISDFVNGLAPTHFVEENASEMLPLGDPDERLLKAALDILKGTPGKKSFEQVKFKTFMDSKDLYPHKKELHLDLKLKLF